jgi:NADH dehydrogenase FAD-containing subunit
VLGAGFGGLELSTLLSESLGDTVEVTVIDKSDYFIFGFSKLDLLFGHADARAVRLPYKNFTKLGVRMLQQTIASIDPVKRRVTTVGVSSKPTIWWLPWAQSTILLPHRGLLTSPNFIRKRAPLIYETFCLASLEDGR